MAKYFAPHINPEGSFVLFSGVHAFKHNVGYLGVGITNGAVDYVMHIAASNPARRIGTADDIASAVLFAMTNTFMTGMTLRVAGGEPLI